MLNQRNVGNDFLGFRPPDVLDSCARNILFSDTRLFCEKIADFRRLSNCCRYFDAISINLDRVFALRA
jgi:hypothetical protein